MNNLPVVYWHWFTFGIILVALEAFVPGAILLWFGLGALAVGVTMLVIPDFMLIAQLGTFIVLSIGGLLIGRQFVRFGGQDDIANDASRRSSYLLGKSVTVIEPIVNGAGKVQVGDSPWRAEGPAMDNGMVGKIVAVNGATVTIEPIKQE